MDFKEIITKLVHTIAYKVVAIQNLINDIDSERISSAAEEARNAAALALLKATMAENTATNLNNTELIRINVENKRINSESVRQDNETSRMRAENLRTQAEISRTTTAGSDHTTASNDHLQAVADHAQAANDHTQYSNQVSSASQAAQNALLAALSAAQDAQSAAEDLATCKSDIAELAESGDIPAATVAKVLEHTELITNLNKNKANTDGYYKNLVSGLSENLIDTKGQGSEQTFFKRTSCGNESITDDGAAMVQKFLGNSVKFAQVVKNGNFVNTDEWVPTITHTKSFTVSNGEATLVKSDVLGMGAMALSTFTPKSTHKYYIKCDAKTSNSSYIARFGFAFQDRTTGTNVQITTTSTSYEKLCGIATPATDDGYFIIACGNSSTPEDIYAVFKNVICLDLTAMGIDSFTTTAQVEAWLAANVGLKPYYGYTEGIVLNNKALGVRTIGFNRYNPSTGKAELVNYTTNGTNQYQITGTYTSISFTDILGNTSVPVIDSNGYFSISQDGVLDVVGGNATDTCVHLCWSGYRDGEWEEYWEQSRTKDLTTVTGKKDGTGESVVIFPDGLCKIGDVSDEIQGNKAIKRFGRLTLTSSMDYTFQSINDYNIANFSFYITGRVAGNGSNSHNIICNLFSEQLSPISNTQAEGFLLSTGEMAFLRISSSKASTVEELQTWLNSHDVEFIYELATPEVYVLDEDFNTSYKVADFGTEEMIPQELDANDLPQSAAFHAIIKYNDDFTRTIANIPKYVQPLLEAIAYLNGEVQGLKDSIKDYAMDMKANIMDVMEYYVYNVPKVLLSSATGAPSASNVPTNWDAQRSGTWDAVPRTEGLVYIDGAGDVWVSNGTASAENWKKVS